MTHAEIDDLILRTIKLYSKDRVDGDTAAVADLTERLALFAHDNAIENDFRIVKDRHLPVRSTQTMQNGDADAIIEWLMSMRSRVVHTDDEIKGLLHPDVLRIAWPRIESGHYADAVESAFKEINVRVKGIYKRVKGIECDGASLMQAAFSDRDPAIELDDLKTQTGHDVQEGYRFMFAGAMKGIRNPKAHANEEISREDALRKLCFASMLMCKLDRGIERSCHP